MKAASGFDVSQDGTRDLNGGANLVADGGAETIVPSGPSPYLYDWDNRDGAGSDASSHLALGSTTLFMNDGSGLRLSLGNAQGKGSLTGSSGGTAISTVRDGTSNPGGSGSISILK